MQRAIVELLGEGLDVGVERNAQRAIGVIVTPLAPRSRADQGCPADQFVAKIDKLENPLLERGKLRLILEIAGVLPFGDDAREFAVALEKFVGVAAHRSGIGRHIDAARFHHDRIDQRVDASDVDRVCRRGRKGSSVFALQPNRLDRHHYQQCHHQGL